MDEKASILIVDDDESIRTSLALIFGEKGYETETAGTGQEAIEKARARSFRVGLVDIRLPDMEGVAILESLRAIHPDMGIIMITGFASQQNAIEALNKGASAYITKPLNMDELLASVRGILEKQWLVKENRKLYEATQRELAERRKAEDNLTQALAAKAHFISVISHELGTPLTAIKEGISLISDETVGDLNVEQKKFLDIAKRNVDRLVRLIRDILTLQRLDSARVRFDVKEHDMNEVIREAYETHVPLAKEKGFDLILKLADDLPRVRFDRDEITQVVTNIIDNAIKFTQRGSIAVSTTQNDNTIQVSIKDTGPGIRKEDMRRLFQSFEQLEKGEEARQRGTGLGLAICKGIIERHRGKIWAESESGKGTAFHFLLPIKERRY